MSIYLDNAATAFPKAPGVCGAVSHYLEHVGANVGRASYGAATEAALAVFEARSKLKTLFDFPGPESCVVFTPGATFGLNMLLRGLLRPGDHAIVGSLEHNAVMRPLNGLAAAGVEFSRIPASPYGITNARELIPLIKANTRLVLVSHASNVCGALMPVFDIAEICHERNIPFALDAAQSAGHVPISFSALGLAALAVPGHKGLLGPEGVGALLLAPGFAERLSPIVSGGTGSASDSEAQPAFLPDKFEPGTLNIPGIYGLGAALDFILERGVGALQARERELTERLIEGLAGLPVRVPGPPAAMRTGVISLDFTGVDNAAAAFLLERDHGILTRCGLHCAPNAHKTLGTFPQGTVRFSIGFSTGQEDIDAAIQAVRYITK